MTKILQLGEITNIQSGYSFRSRIVNIDDGELGVVQAKDVASLYIDEADIARISQDYTENRIQQVGDVLLTSRGSFRASVGNFSRPTIASSSLFVISPISKDFLSEYIAIYLNSEASQYYLNQNAKGATIQSISIDDLKNLSIPHIPLENQRIIIDLQRNVEQQSSILRRKQTIIDRILKSSVSQTAE